MPFVSYAENFEDITLWRTFRLFGPGQYIDVGANHPTLHSVTRSLYERGWRGINIEPVQHYFQALCEERTEDVNLCVAAGNQKGECVFYENVETGLSTLDQSFADEKKKEGISFKERSVETTTLDAVCEKYLLPDRNLHFVKIDVEGFEMEVLRGFDLKKWRPWLILIECVYNVTPDWEPRITDADYVFAKCDGINKYYVAKERMELLNPLSLQPNVLDDFYLCEGHLLGYPNKDISHGEQHRLDSAEDGVVTVTTKPQSPSVAETSSLMLAKEIVKRIKRKIFRRASNQPEST